MAFKKCKTMEKVSVVSKRASSSTFFGRTKSFEKRREANGEGGMMLGAGERSGLMTSG
jgi:hypothetical protein